MVKVQVKKLKEEATIPFYAKEGDAGFDLRACIKESVTIKPGETKIIPTGLAMAIPFGYEVQVRPRSGMSAKTKIRIGNSPGTIDSGYRGEIGVIVDNIGDTDYTINHEDRIAQGVLNKVPTADFELVEELSETDRGTGGFGSTGTN